VADLVIVVDHHSAKIFQIDVGSNEAAEHVIRPYDPHHLLDHLSHKDQTRERGQRAPEEPAYYGEIAAAVAPGGRIVVVGHGTGNSNAADHLMAYLKAHHVEVFQRVAGEVSADLSAATPHQLLELALQVLRA
jgi:predicted dienelactone hydrolase